MFVKIATPRRRHVTEMKCIIQIRYMAIDKWLELQKCTWSVSMWFQYGVISLYASWHGIKEALDIFLGNVPPCSLYESPQSIKSRCWRTLANKSPINHIPDMFNGWHVWQTCRPGKQWYQSSLEEGMHNPCHVWPGHCPAETWQVELPQSVKPP